MPPTGNLWDDSFAEFRSKKFNGPRGFTNQGGGGSSGGNLIEGEWVLIGLWSDWLNRWTTKGDALDFGEPVLEFVPFKRNIIRRSPILSSGSSGAEGGVQGGGIIGFKNPSTSKGHLKDLIPLIVRDATSWTPNSPDLKLELDSDQIEFINGVFMELFGKKSVLEYFRQFLFAMSFIPAVSIEATILLELLSELGKSSGLKSTVAKQIRQIVLLLILQMMEALLLLNNAHQYLQSNRRPNPEKDKQAHEQILRMLKKIADLGAEIRVHLEYLSKLKF